MIALAGAGKDPVGQEHGEEAVEEAEVEVERKDEAEDEDEFDDEPPEFENDEEENVYAEGLATRHLPSTNYICEH